MKEVLKDFETKSNAGTENLDTIETQSNILIKNALFIRNKGNLVKVKFEDILWMKGDGNYTTLVTRTNVFSLRNILKEFEAVLPDQDFIRIHKSYLVRIDEINTINPRELKVCNDLVPVGRTYYQNLINGINKLGSGNLD
ncbi:transcriptional regulator [Rhodonellum psychrophilum GCM71 = DSM 17998]|uniref:Transcriptional regulator n=2 Tax=Rhodonellum TaxID=336827 RepID=U5BZW7_9BACT|nr:MULTISPECIES: LytTR family DNA-binding domain-containing protein [Rhodonellum]ERM81442.1 transcriptional regulator [Rhodonellum psychrophilum GCM71 = DSM 17998]SDZ27320.1 LytTr DNA-binding domain-containing protein [Rhodonellum ikkaensis]